MFGFFSIRIIRFSRDNLNSRQIENPYKSNFQLGPANQESIVFYYSVSVFLSCIAQKVRRGQRAAVPARGRACLRRVRSRERDAHRPAVGQRHHRFTAQVQELVSGRRVGNVLLLLLLP